MKPNWLLLSLTLASTIKAADITVYNKSDTDIYAATYYHSYLKRGAKQQAAERISSVDKPIKSNSSQKILLPSRKLTAHRELIFSTQKDRLKPSICYKTKRKMALLRYLSLIKLALA